MKITSTDTIQLEKLYKNLKRDGEEVTLEKTPVENPMGNIDSNLAQKALEEYEKAVKNVDKNSNDRVFLPKNYILDNRYLIKEILGSGGDINTYLAKDLNLNKNVVIEEFDIFTSYGSSTIFKEKALAFKSLSHPNIAKIINIIDTNNTSYSIREYIEGDILFSLDIYSEEIIIKITIALLDALSYMNKSSLFHNDIHTGNVILDKNFQPYWIDYLDDLGRTLISTLNYIKDDDSVFSIIFEILFSMTNGLTINFLKIDSFKEKHLNNFSKDFIDILIFGLEKGFDSFGEFSEMLKNKDLNINEPQPIELFEPLEINNIFINKYRIKSFLGQGAFSMVYLAEEVTSKYQLLIEEFFPRNIAYRSKNNEIYPLLKAKRKYQIMREAFIEGVRNIVKINVKPHKNIVGFIFLEMNFNNTIYYGMPYQEGEEFKTILKRRREENKPFKEQEILKIIISILDGLEHIHKFGIYHKDIKPANIYIREDGEPLIIDFGASVTSANLLTPAYASIEQVNNEVGLYGAYTDIYALGVMVYEIVTGAKPPKSKDRAEAIFKGEGDSYFPLVENEQVRKYSKNFLKTIDKCLEFSYKDRPQTCAEVKEMLTKRSWFF